MKQNAESLFVSEMEQRIKKFAPPLKTHLRREYIAFAHNHCSKYPPNLSGKNTRDIIKELRKYVVKMLDAADNEIFC